MQANAFLVYVAEFLSRKAEEQRRQEEQAEQRARMEQRRREEEEAAAARREAHMQQVERMHDYLRSRSTIWGQRMQGRDASDDEQDEQPAR